MCTARVACPPNLKSIYFAQDADMIIVLDHGEIIERGNHQSLLALDGKYAELCRDQSMATA